MKQEAHFLCLLLYLYQLLMKSFLLHEGFWLHLRYGLKAFCEVGIHKEYSSDRLFFSNF